MTWWLKGCGGGGSDRRQVVGSDMVLVGCVGIDELTPGVAQKWALAEGLDSSSGGRACW